MPLRRPLPSILLTVELARHWRVVSAPGDAEETDKIRCLGAGPTFMTQYVRPSCFVPRYLDVDVPPRHGEPRTHRDSLLPHLG